jgi:hypothetical protein
MRIVRRVPLFALVVAVAAAIALPVTASAAARISVKPFATKVLGSADVVVRVNVTCDDPVGGTYVVGLHLSQRQGTQLVIGTGAETFNCTGAPQVVALTVSPQPGQPAFKRGLGFVLGSGGFYGSGTSRAFAVGVVAIV